MYSFQRRGSKLSNETIYGLIPYKESYVNEAYIFEPFIVASLRHTCAIIMLSNQHLDMPQLRGGWIISAKEGEVLTNTDLDRFVNNIWEK